MGGNKLALAAVDQSCACFGNLYGYYSGSGMFLRRLKSVLYSLAVVLCLILAGAVLTSHTAFANANLDRATEALNSSKYNDVVKYVGAIVSSGKQKPEVLAKALLLRGIAYRHQGKVAQSIADLSNAEWVRKLSGSELRRLYAERALAYDVAGQKALADKDRKQAGAGNLKVAKPAAIKTPDGISINGVRRTSVEASKSTTGQFFDGLGNLFGFNSNSKKQVVQPPVQAKVAGVTKDPGIREIPTLDSKESKTNAEKLKLADLPPETGSIKAKAKQLSDSQKTVEKNKVTAVPSNSAWAAKRADEMNTEQKVLTSELKKTASLQTPDDQKNDAIVTSSPIVLNSAAKKPTVNYNPVGTFIDNIFGGGSKKKADTPVNPGDDVIAADQVVDAQKKSNTAVSKTQIKSKINKALKKSKVAAVPKKKAAAKKTVVAAAKPAAKVQSRSLYHVQLGVFGEPQAADKFVSRLNTKYASLVGDKSAMVVETDLGQSRRQYRVYLGPYRSRDKGKKTCSVLTRLGMGCSLVE